MSPLTLHEKQTLTMFSLRLRGGYLSQVKSLLNNIDPTGGLVAIDDQIDALFLQYRAAQKQGDMVKP